MRGTTIVDRGRLRRSPLVKSIIAGVAAIALLTACLAVPGEIEPLRATSPSQAQSEAINITSWETFGVSRGDDSLPGAVDGDPDTWWTAYDVAPQWFALFFQEPHPVNRIELTAAQVEEGPTTHEIWLRNEFGLLILYKRFPNVPTADHDIFTIDIDPPREVTEVRILTRKGQGWVAWREVQVFAPSSLPLRLLSRGRFDLMYPVQVTHAGDGSGRLFVLEKEGRIRIVKDNLILETPFLDIAERVSAADEQGLLNVAFPPSYLNSQRFYVNYNDRQGNTVISRFTTSADPDIADSDSEEVILTFHQIDSYHNGGTLKFGPRDGYLYIASGDGLETKPGIVPLHSQNPGSMLGKILRIDVESGVSPYAIPPDNPFVSTPGYAPEIWAMGLRNPWGMTFDEKTGDLYITDTGWLTSEEINFQPADSPGGQNYGWPMWEGNGATKEIEGTVDNPVWPVAVYGRQVGCAIVGGAMHEGAFIYGDFCTGNVWSLKRQGQDKWEAGIIAGLRVPISSIGADESGKLYATGYLNGTIYRLPLLENRSR